MNTTFLGGGIWLREDEKDRRGVTSAPGVFCCMGVRPYGSKRNCAVRGAGELDGDTRDSADPWEYCDIHKW